MHVEIKPQKSAWREFWRGVTCGVWEPWDHSDWFQRGLMWGGWAGGLFSGLLLAFVIGALS